ncbi:CAAX prenyl protease-related protein [Nitratidesulfovibrio sp.]|uniref:CAAX prenyl protease-related protein n=1 Tax=Nitratidesulfovibrio sp. TaxID=2802297 RepID=UPI0033421B44
MTHRVPSAPLSAMLPRIVPYLAYMGFVFVTEVAGLLGLPVAGASSLLYPVKAVCVAVALWVCLPRCGELRVADLARLPDTVFAVAVGVIVFVAWRYLDVPWARLGTPEPFDPDALGEKARTAMIGMRLFGGGVLVPLAEELFWRSFLIRYLQGGDFRDIRPGRLHALSFVIVAVLFGLEHHLVVAGMLAGVAYNVVLYRTGSVAQCVLSHAVTNSLLGLWVLLTGAWTFM